MGYAKPYRDRRLHERIDLDKKAVVFQRGNPVGRYTLQNLSASGALITGERDLGKGHLVHLLIHLESDREPMGISASIHEVRKANQGIDLALTFPSLSADQEDRIHDAVLKLLVRDRLEDRAPVLVFEPRVRVRHEIENEIRSFGMRVESTSDLMEAVQALEDDDIEYAGLVIHSAAHDSTSMDVVEFFAQKEELRTIILPEPGHPLPERVERLARLPHVSVPRLWNRDALRGILAD